MDNDYFDLTKEKLEQLNFTERKMYNYVIQNIDKIKEMSIRQFSQRCYVSTATVYRFIKKLGFNGYTEFTAFLKLTDKSRSQAVIPPIMKYKGYSEDYLKNLIESVRVIRKEQVKKFCDVLKHDPQIYIFGSGLTTEAARYIEHLFIAFGCRADFVYEDFQADAAVKHMTDDDMVIMMSYTGENEKLIRILEMIKGKCKPLLVSITRSDNNMVQLMTDLNFYFFVDEITYNGYDLTSRVAMIAIMEIILYEFFKDQQPVTGDV